MRLGPISAAYVRTSTGTTTRLNPPLSTQLHLCGPTRSHYFRRLFHCLMCRIKSASRIETAEATPHQWPAETVFSQGHRLVGALASLSEQSGSPADQTSTGNTSLFKHGQGVL